MAFRPPAPPARGLSSFLRSLRPISTQRKSNLLQELHCKKYTNKPLRSVPQQSLRAHPRTATSPILQSIIISSAHTPRRKALSPYSARPISTKPLPAPRSRAGRFVYRSLFYFGGFIAVISSAIVAFFIYDATTYHTEPEVVDIPVSAVALNPRRGGPKHLQIAEHFVDDDDTPQKKNQKHKPKLVILGTGWGAVAVLKQLNPDDYHVTVVSPSNHFLFTPMLPSATVGTLELRSLVEPVRRIVGRVHGHFLRARAEDVDFSEKLVEVSADGPNGKQHFYVPYDKLVIAVGKTVTEGRGLSKCSQ
jgi:NADH:ubiquinone reductase (H+-translocating)